MTKRKYFHTLTGTGKCVKKNTLKDDILIFCHGMSGCFIHEDFVEISEIIIRLVIPAQAGIQNLIIILDSVSRFACTE
jgi:hypothetical protein